MSVVLPTEWMDSSINSVFIKNLLSIDEALCVRCWGYSKRNKNRGSLRLWDDKQVDETENTHADKQISDYELWSVPWIK